MRSYLQLQKYKWKNKQYHKKSMKQYRIHHESDFIKMSIHVCVCILFYTFKNSNQNPKRI